MDEKTISKLDENVKVHNIGEERNVGLINYELSIRGKENLGSASRKVVLKRSADLIQEKGTEFSRFKKEAKEIEEIKIDWNEKMKELAKEGKLYTILTMFWTISELNF